MTSNPLQRLAERGQSIWLDYISRELVTSGEMERLIDEDFVTGLTSNPTIFEKAIVEGSDYDEQIRQLLGDGVSDPNEIFLSLAISDIRRAADILRPVWERSGGGDGFASLEVLPSLAHDTQSTVATARRLWERLDRPNVMIKIPATAEGVPAVERSIAAGININVTLIFALESHERVVASYIGGLESRRAAGETLDVHSVASFFVSRVDTAVDGLLQRKLAEDPGNPLLEELQGKAAIANAVLAYELFLHTFHGDGFSELRKAGAAVQRPLWASTSAKNPNYRDVIYAEALIGAGTVDTMPPGTIEAFRDHGIVEGDTISRDIAGAHRVMEQLASVGIDMKEVTSRLLDDGVQAFETSYEKLVRRIAEKVDSMNGGYGRRQLLDLGPVAGSFEQALTTPETAETVGRIWDRDPDVWKPGDREHAATIRNRLGWLDLPVSMRDCVPTLLGLAGEVEGERFRDAVLVGMGGSSLCPEVLRAAFGSAAGHPALHVLDTTDPEAIGRLTLELDVRSTLFIVSSKSGTTLETLCHLDHFWETARRAGIAEPGRHFIAVTDPGSPLADTARERRFRRIFENPPDIGGRYSALSLFGLVPGAVAGIDAERLLERAAAMRAQCSPGTPADLNCAVALGTALAASWAAGRDKVTIVAPAAISAFSLWAEQLLAESTGKEGRGLIPVGDEPLGDPSRYGDDRVFVALPLGADAEFDARVAALRDAGQPVVTLPLGDLYDLGAEFYRWELATAVAATALRIDPFDEPNVQESKDNTRRMLDAYERDGSIPEEEPRTVGEGLSVFGGPGASTPRQGLEGFLDQLRHGDYAALMAYVTPGDAVYDALQSLRVVIRDRHRVATTLGFGPRFLHSTGQLHKGGPNTGLFLQITADDRVDVPIPGRPFTFSVLERAQAAGDLQSLRDHGRRALRLHIHEGRDVAEELRALAAELSRGAGVGAAEAAGAGIGR